MNTSPKTTPKDPPRFKTMEDLRSYLEITHGILLEENDPFLMVHTIHHAFLNDYESMLDRHHKAITKVMSSAVEGLTSQDIAQNLAEQKQMFERTAQIFERQYKRAKILSILNLSIFCIFALVFISLFIQ